MTDIKPLIEIVIDRDARSFMARDRLVGTEQEPRPLPAGDMPWRLEVAAHPREAGEIEVRAVDDRRGGFDPAHATACSVLALDAWITDKVFESHDDTIYCVRVANTSTHYVAEEICVDLAIDPACDAALGLLPDKHSLLEITPAHQCVKCLPPRHYIDLKFVAIARGTRPGVFPVRACVSYEMVYWTRAPARTHARLELEVHDECRPRRDPCRPPRAVPPSPGDLRPVTEPECPVDLFRPCGHDDPPPPPAKAPPEPDCGCEPEAAAPAQPTEPPHEPAPLQQSPPAKEVPALEPANEADARVACDHGDVAPQEPDETKGSEPMSNDKYGKHDHDHDYHHHHHHQGQPNKKKVDEDVSEKDRKGCAPACSNADEFLPIVDDCRLPEGGVLEFSYTFRKGFIGNAGKGGRCVYGKLASNGKVECRLESIDDTVLVLDVTNHSHFHLKHVRIHGVRIFQNHEEVTMLLPSGHPVAQIIPTASYIGSLHRGESKWIALSFITRGIAPGGYAVKFCVDYDIEACSVTAGINVEISRD